MYRSVVNRNQYDHRLNVLLPIGNATYRLAKRCLKSVSVPRKVFLAKPLGDVTRGGIEEFSDNWGPNHPGCHLVLESWYGKLVSCKWMRQVPCSFR